MLSVAAFLTNLPGTRNKDSNPYLSEHLIQSDHLSQVGGKYFINVLYTHFSMLLLLLLLLFTLFWVGRYT